MKRKIKCNKKNKRIYFLNSKFTLIAIWFWAPAVTFQDKLLQFDFRWDLFYFFFVTPRYPHYAVDVRDRCHAPLLLEHSEEEPLGYRWLIRHFGDIHRR